MTGKLIVLYGINNLGKSTQARILVERLNSAGRKAKYLKYPIYDLEPTGPALNSYLRGGNPDKLTAKDAQILYAKNREQYEPTLKMDLESGRDVVAEDYWGTGVAWGIGGGVDKDFLLEINRKFNFEDIAILLGGKRFESSIEKDHLHETDAGFINKVDAIHKELAAEFGWKIVDANQDKEKVAEDIWQEVIKILH
ncbi:MAG: hypothetical protein A3C85_04205 [Candidatus Doudnabacteria bacterium RIFCSPHIGHO2_02_FULL_48_21]|uniref:Thymidylate kinase-like domain-containing protein n=1 Tax=Candidatus Doudnabacteria bacterium RIFCSPLOWO2_02_FULL_48_13 TaxID=1817845 RepID=A0A1F5QBD7_9BACT|nr:MAG: hypothetical protein A3K05_00890 [Candidatus Doudnabacteria bacterium RIFCSPHIGHO2_01_48_18]OGE78865.1 MAG: hypothetical protein A2668_00605 [Candidatus Doudnabacteria bacterium RIFCSPHIGHO2_01_FULL_48_180]OGE91856.1 MAG: hypothetical protein A3F44_04285 [Candidatus Doudnabacteria bacterium RIFCSPHIGHO2_12_FULL_47_25]OGE94093.1 MAG: hypothetical protein A3C85_04205 [Candidatus Doudnabacteria bacterium RIFCSPHIGHO2_02_FULL_48_21]OGE98201.1 MAG: hypothetical protein A3A83_03470 [Candidatu